MSSSNKVGNRPAVRAVPAGQQDFVANCVLYVVGSVLVGVSRLSHSAGKQRSRADGGSGAGCSKRRVVGLLKMTDSRSVKIRVQPC